MAPRVGVLLSRVRVEEKLLLAELESRGVEAKVIDDRELVLAVEHKPELGVDVVLERCIQHGTALYARSWSATRRSQRSTVRASTGSRTPRAAVRRPTVR